MNCPLCEQKLKLVNQLSFKGVRRKEPYFICINNKCKNFYRRVNVGKIKREEELRRMKVEQKKTELFRQQRIF